MGIKEAYKIIERKRDSAYKRAEARKAYFYLNDYKFLTITGDTYDMAMEIIEEHCPEVLEKEENGN